MSFASPLSFAALLLGLDLLTLERFARVHGGQAVRILIVRGVVLVFLIGGKEAVELHHRAGGAHVRVWREAGRGAGLEAVDQGADRLRAREAGVAGDRGDC